MKSHWGQRPSPFLIFFVAIFCGALFFAHSPYAQAQAVDAQTSRITLSLATEPPTLNSAQATDTIANFLLSHLMEGLLRYGQDGSLQGGVAERWELTETGARFWLRKNARWSDGKPVTADDFVFAWRYALKPETASQYAFILYPLRNAEAINRGELPVENLGVRAVGAHELRVEFEKPCPYFLGLTAFMSYMPLREDMVQRWQRAYAADADKLLYNGPYIMSEWIHGASIRLRRNPNYWGRNEVAIAEIDLPYFTADTSAQFNLFRDKRIALASLDSGQLDKAVEQGFDIHQFQTGALFFLEFNFRKGRITANKSFRKALQALLDPSILVNKILGMPGVLPAYSLFPTTVTGPIRSTGEASYFRDQFPVRRVTANLDQARDYLERAKKELGITAFPPLHLLVGDSPRALQEAEYYQYVLKRGLGLELRIDQQIFKQRLEKMRRGDFDIVAAAWGPDYDDIMTFADLFSSWNDNNRGRYNSPHYDALVSQAANTADPKLRFQAMAELQELVVEDVPILPTYESASLYVQHPQLRGVRRSIFGGDPNFRDAWIALPEGKR
ncbi:peptide ABC transporter substrate-binding protein [Spongiibacter sp. KMU-158]|uniref:Peptide ABC transporter substrate-binding protein n=1 Tax=Spongiibacter pelagi TaxID=2760804 RepID=A0A927C1U6_9GAMM|nr:peptide ABC transporter substrate-binding protein [Spongiibacter pelagi]MBD2858487.1 peptide ABC transporter substrate-binding protein [Spongiibacter pelagi]